MQMYKQVTFNDLKVHDKVAIPENGESFVLNADRSIGNVTTVKIFEVKKIDIVEDYAELYVVREKDVFAIKHLKNANVFLVYEEEQKKSKFKTIKG
jgi:hypothetical protein